MARSFYKENNEVLAAIEFVETQPEGFTLITDESELKRLYISLYKQREIDGINYFEDFRAKIMLNVINGIHTDLEAFNLESHIKYLQDEIIIGNWLTAQNINQNLALSGIYDQAMKDEIQIKIDNYVLNNY
jgi:hypothetical protein